MGYIYIAMNVGISWVQPGIYQAMTVEKPPEMQRPVNLSALVRPRRRVKGAAFVKVSDLGGGMPILDGWRWRIAIGVNGEKNLS